MFLTKNPKPVPEPDARLDQPDWLLIGCQLKAKREQLNKTEADLAHELCLSVKQVKAMEAGKTWPFPGVAPRQWCVQRYARAVGLVWGELYAYRDAPAQAANDYDTAAETTVVSPPAQIASPGPRTSVVSKHFIVSLLLLAMLAAVVVGASLIENEPISPDLAPTGYQRNETKETLRNSEVIIADVASEASVITASEIAPVIAPAPAPAIAEQQPVDGTLAATPVIAPPSAPIESSEIIEFHGRDAAKKSGSIYIHASAAVTVIKKRKDSPGEGDRIELQRGAERRIPISTAEVIGVAEGTGFKVYFQGQLVPHSMFRAGRWVRFIAAR
jgi:cytoskeletal protein RodZ